MSDGDYGLSLGFELWQEDIIKIAPEMWILLCSMFSRLDSKPSNSKHPASSIKYPASNTNLQSSHVIVNPDTSRQP
jgi:hypothetical protein